MEYYRIGRVVNTHGIRGQIKVIADTDFPESRFASGNKLYILKDDQALAQVTVLDSRQAKGTYILSFEEFDNINQVEGFKGSWLAIDSSSQEELEDDVYYHHQIIGLEVVTHQGLKLGKIKEILQLGSNDVWVVKRHENNKADALIPYIDDVVKEVDLEKGQVIISLMEGLIDDED